MLLDFWQTLPKAVLLPRLSVNLWSSKRIVRRWHDIQDFILAWVWWSEVQHKIIASQLVALLGAKLYVRSHDCQIWRCENNTKPRVVQQLKPTLAWSVRESTVPVTHLETSWAPAYGVLDFWKCVDKEYSVAHDKYAKTDRGNCPGSESTIRPC